MIKGIIFDLDGTTLSTLEDIKDSLNITLEKNKYPTRTLEQVRLGVGNGSRNLIRASIPDKDDQEKVEKILKEYVETYAQNYNIKTRPYKGIKETLKNLQSSGIQMAINTNKPDAIAKKLIEESFPEIEFVEVMGQSDKYPRKPDPAVAYAIIEKMNLRKEEVLYVGDSETDIQTAKNAKLISIGCLWGFRDRQTLEKSGADHIISKPEELLKYIGD